jgi:hypothetical protein
MSGGFPSIFIERSGRTHRPSTAIRYDDTPVDLLNRRSSPICRVPMTLTHFFSI